MPPVNQQYTLSAPGSQECVVHVPNVEAAKLCAHKFGAKYGVIGAIDIYGPDPSEHRPIAEVLPYPRGYVYHFIYCASEHGSLMRYCKDHHEAQKVARALANAHGESCHWSVSYDQGEHVQAVGREEPTL